MKKKPRWLSYLGNYTTQVYRDYNTPIKGSLLTNQDSMASNKGFFRGSFQDAYLRCANRNLGMLFTLSFPSLKGFATSITPSFPKFPSTQRLL